MGKIVIISGPSGSGKTTVCEKLVNFPQVEGSVSVTTRSPRYNEKEGESYYFVTHEEFEAMIQKGEFVEYAKYCDYYYGTPYKALNKALKKDCLYLLEIEVQGALQIMEKFPEALSIFLLPPNTETQNQRLIKRNTNKEEERAVRIKIAETEMKYKEKYNHCVVNDDLEETMNTLCKILGLA